MTGTRVDYRCAVVIGLGLVMMGCQRADPVAETAPAARVDAQPEVRATAFALDGTAVDPLAKPATDVVVLTFVTPDCPVSNRYAPELARIAADAPVEQVSWWLVYPDPDVDAAQIEAHQREYALPGTPVRDPDHVLVARAQAKVTPEVAVFRRDAGGAALVYHGRIDDRVPEYGRARPEPTKRELVDVLAAVTNGGEVAVASAVAVGCPIGDLR